MINRIEDAEKDLTIRLWDKDPGTSDSIGLATIKVKDLILNFGIDQWFDIQYNNNWAGQIRLKSQFEIIFDD